MGMSLCRFNQETRPFTQVNMTMHQSTRRPSLMAEAVIVILILINHLDSNERYSNYLEPNAEPPEFWSRVIHSLGTSDISRFFNMPRARGNPHRGTTWYSFESHR
jgi:hypothetical protein